MPEVSEERRERHVQKRVRESGTDLDAKDISGTRRPFKGGFRMSSTKERNSTDAEKNLSQSVILRSTLNFRAREKLGGNV